MKVAWVIIVNVFNGVNHCSVLISTPHFSGCRVFFRTSKHFSTASRRIGFEGEEHHPLFLYLICNQINVKPFFLVIPRKECPQKDFEDC